MLIKSYSLCQIEIPKSIPPTRVIFMLLLAKAYTNTHVNHAMQYEKIITVTLYLLLLKSNQQSKSLLIHDNVTFFLSRDGH